MAYTEIFGCVRRDWEGGHLRGGEAGGAVGLGGGGEDAMGVGDGVGFWIGLEGDSGYGSIFHVGHVVVG